MEVSEAWASHLKNQYVTRSEQERVDCSCAPHFSDQGLVLFDGGRAAVHGPVRVCKSSSQLVQESVARALNLHGALQKGPTDTSKDEPEKD